MQVEAFGKSDPGRVRPKNEDSYLVDSEAGLYVVADGVGGSRAGAMASRLFCDVVKQHREVFKKALAEPHGEATRHELLQLMENVFNLASERIYRLSERRSEYRGMATTGVILAVGQGGAVLGHVGDSRAYHITGKAIRQLTVDHSLAQEMLNQGLIREDELETFPHRNVLARAVGQLPTVRVDTAWLDVAAGDAVLLCTDGLFRYYDDDELMQTVEQGLEYAIELANERGGEDNLTAVLVRSVGAPEPHETLDTQAKIVCIQSLFLFRYLNYPELVRVLKIVYERHFANGEVIFHEGEPGDAMYLVVAGSVAVRKGHHHLTTVGTGGHFGELAFMDGHPRSATVLATEPTTVLQITRDDFRALTRTEPVIASKLLWCFVLNMAGRLRDLSRSYVAARAERDN